MRHSVPFMPISYWKGTKRRAAIWVCHVSSTQASAEPALWCSTLALTASDHLQTDDLLVDRWQGRRERLLATMALLIMSSRRVLAADGRLSVVRKPRS